MLSYLIKFAKRALTILLIGMLLSTSTVNANDVEEVRLSFIKPTVTEQVIPAWQQREYDVIIRVGEYNGKEGKRVYIDNGINWKDIASDIPIHKDSQGHYISEYDINYKVANKLVRELKSQGVNAKLQVANSRKEDLNAAGRISNASNPKLYISLHHNYYNETSRGYFVMYNQNDTAGMNIAARLSNAIKDNNLVPQKQNRANDGYIGELNTIHNSTIPVLMELGFFSNLDELKIICGDDYTNYVSNNLSKEIQSILKDYWR